MTRGTLSSHSWRRWPNNRSCEVRCQREKRGSGSRAHADVLTLLTAHRPGVALPLDLMQRGWLEALRVSPT
eukprot:scaffold16485_cov65-Phaeocystis_antarctica.AAC.8